MPHGSREKLKEGNVALVTIKLIAGVPSLRRGEAFDEVRIAIARVNKKGLIRIVEYSIQSNHVHMLVEAAKSADLSKGMASLNGGLAMRLNRIWDRVGMGTVFTERFHLVVINNPTRMRNALLYVLRNDRHHGMGLKGLDPCSSAPFFRGFSDRQPQAEDGSRVNVHPEKWLLQFGWQKRTKKPDKLLSIHDSPSIDKGIRIQALEA